MLQCNLNAIYYNEVRYITRNCIPLPTTTFNQSTNRCKLFTSFCSFPQNDPFKHDSRTSINYPLKQQRLDKCSNVSQRTLLLNYKSLSNSHKFYTNYLRNSYINNLKN